MKSKSSRSAHELNNRKKHRPVVDSNETVTSLSISEGELRQPKTYNYRHCVSSALATRIAGEIRKGTEKRSMNILVIGSGGREHAICHAFARIGRSARLFCAPGNAGIAQIAECVPLQADDIGGLVEFATVHAIDLTFVGSESPLAAGIADAFEEKGLRIVGASKKAARLEASKAFAKDFMKRHGVPTANYALASSAAEAVAILESGEFDDAASPVVVKADGLAAGKGVIVASNRLEAIAAINGLEQAVGSAAVEKIVLEECLFGREVSLIMFADGEDFALMPPTRDHKRIGEGDTGPNTGGMGTITDDSLLDPEQRDEIVARIIKPTLRGCIEEGFPFRGVLFVGLMITERGPLVLEYNVRFGDPETQSILMRLETDLVYVCEAMLEGRLDEIDIEWRPGNSATVVLAAEGYPRSPRMGDVISGLGKASTIPGVTIFHAGTTLAAEGAAASEGTSQSSCAFITAGGRVLGVTAVGDSLAEALDTAYAAVEKISWKGMQYRRDIGR